MCSGHSGQGIRPWQGFGKTWQQTKRHCQKVTGAGRWPYQSGGAKVEVCVFLRNCISHTMTDEPTGPEDRPRMEKVPPNKGHPVSVFTKRENATLAQCIEILNWYHANGKNRPKTAKHFSPIHLNNQTASNFPMGKGRSGGKSGHRVVAGSTWQNKFVRCHIQRLLKCWGFEGNGR